MEILPRFHPSNLPNLIVQEGILRKSYKSKYHIRVMAHGMGSPTPYKGISTSKRSAASTSRFQVGSSIGIPSRRRFSRLRSSNSPGT